MAFLRKIRRNSRIVACPQLLEFTSKKITVRVGDGFGAPRLIGIFQPILLLPNVAMTRVQLNNILRHEITHFKRRDILYKWFATLVKCVHWFNPVVYYVARKINIECEISCDYAVVSAMNKQEEVSYINTILVIMSPRKPQNMIFTAGMADNAKQIKRKTATLCMLICIITD